MTAESGNNKGPKIPAEGTDQDSAAAKKLREGAVEFATLEESGSWEREGLLDDFAENPTDDAIWEKAYALARTEEQKGESLYSEFKDIPANALIELSHRVRTLPDFRDRYRLMGEKSPNGRLWFDVLTGFSGPDIERALERLLQQGIGGKASGESFSVGADLGCGTGRITEILAEHCEQTIGIDASDALLEVAKERSKGKATYEMGDVTHLPFADSSIDILTAVGVIGALDAEQESLFFDEVSRVLKDGGMLVDGSFKNNSQDAIIKLSWKNALADMIVDTVSGKNQVEHLNPHKRQEVLRRNGLATYGYRFGEIQGVHLETYQKDPKKLAAQYAGYSRNSSG